jgi:parallel beta-helix repeat protein
LFTPFVSEGGGFSSDTTVISNNKVTNAPFGGIVVDSMDKSTLTGNVVTNSGFYGILSQGAFNNDVILAGNTLNDNPVGGRFESGDIDLTGETNAINGGDVGLQFDPAQTYGIIGFEDITIGEGEGSFTLPGFPIFGFTAASLNLVDNTIGTTAFTGQSTYYVELRNGALFAPGTPTIENGLNASYDGFSPASVGGVLTQVQYDHLESMIQHYRDDNTLGLFFFGLVPNDDINQDDIFDFFDGFNGPTGRFSITILGLPKTGGGNGGGGGGNIASFLAGINPAAGGDDNQSPDDLADITPASGGNGNGQTSEDASCWSQAMAQASSGATVNFSFGGNMEESLAQAAACGQGSQF